MKTNIIINLIVGFLITSCFAQGEVESWQSYIASYDENKPGSTTVRMDIFNQAPMSNYQYVLVTGITYESNREDGFPEDETFQILHKVGDELIKLIDDNTENIFVGSFMFDFERLEYFYVKTDKNIERRLKKFYEINYPNNKYYINIKEDKNWDYYREFLYPSDEIKEYLADQEVVEALKEAGDNLDKARRVDHWAYFNDELKKESFEKEIKKLGFQIQNSTKIEHESTPFQIQFYRIDNVDLDSIYSITSMLRKLTITFEGNYDGWETFVKKE